jgi:hypothetical protein
MSNIKIILFLSCIVLMALPALATDYVATLTVDKVEVINGVNTWASAQTFVLNKTQSHNYLGMTTVTFTDIDTTQSPIQISLTTTGNGATTGFVLIPGQTKSIRGRYADNATASSVDDIRINLISLVPYTTTTYYNGTTSPFNAYINTNNQQLSLTRNPTSPPMDSFDASKYYTSQNSGWSGSGQRNEVDVYFVRQASDIGADISVVGKSTTGTVLTAPAYEQDPNQMVFNIITNGIYTFTLKYSNTNLWGYASDVTDLYVLKVDGITSTSSSTPIYPTTPYERLHELGKTDVEIDEIINMAKEYSKHADAVYINREGTKGYLNRHKRLFEYAVVQCQFVDGDARWFMQDSERNW